MSEPNPANTTRMVYKMLASIYQRNVLASLVKYLLLKPLLDTLTTSKLITDEKKGIFFRIHQRLWEIVFESVLLSFNGSNYDNYLICNSLIRIQCNLREKIKIFKKGNSISTVIVSVKKNMCTYNANAASPKSKKFKNKQIWPMKLYFKDVRNLVASNMSLDKVGKLFNLDVSKLAFPYEQARSVSTLKNIHSLRVHDDTFWTNTFNSHPVALDHRLEAQQIFTEKKHHHLYEFSCYYLKQDCMLLHNVILTLFQTYLLDNLNIYTRRSYSQSSLAFQQYFIVEPSKQITKVLAPKLINNTFYNHCIKQAVTGGLCTSFVHGKLDKDVIINEFFKYLQKPNLSAFHWPNFSNITSSWEQSFNQTPTGISTIDIRSLYPSASVKKIPVGTPLFYTRFTSKDHSHLYEHEKFYRALNLKQYCTNARQAGCSKTDIFRLVSEPPKSINEYKALGYYLNTLPKNIEILHFQSGFTAFGQLMFVQYPIDGCLTFRENNIICIKLIQYQSAYCHGHRPNCHISNSEEEQKKFENTQSVRLAIESLCAHFVEHFKFFLSEQLEFEYVELYDCDFSRHQVPKNENNVCLPFYKTKYDYNAFLQTIYNKQLTGLLVVRNLKIAKYNQNPMMGFIIHGMEYGREQLSPYTQTLATKINTGKRVVAVHEVKGFIVISTEYFNWLRITFGFAEEPDIFHALFFQLDDYLRKSIETKLKIRQNLKKLIKTEQNPHLKQNYEVKAELIKLMLNSCYGYTLCNLTSTKFKQFENRRTVPRNVDNILTCIQLDKSVFVVQTQKAPKELFTTMLGHVGCYILFHSKIILLKRLYFLLRYLDPRLAQLCYMDTDSAHFLLKYPTFVENVPVSLQPIFKAQFDKHFDTGNKISGIWVEEGYFECADYLGEKCYRLYNKTNSTYVTHMKGLNTFFQKEFHHANIDPKKTAFLSYNIFFKTADFLIFKTNMSKNIFDNYIPNKRYFVCSTGSLPLKI